MFELRRKRPVGSGAGPVIGPRAIPVGSDVDHGLDREAHARFGSTHGLVLSIVGNIWGAVEQLVDAVTTVALDHTAVAALCMLFDHISRVPEKHTRLHQVDGHVQTLSRSLDNANGVGVRPGLISDIVGFVQVTMVTVVVQCHVDVDNVTVLERSLVGNAVADGLVDRGADGLGEMHVIQGRRIRLDLTQYRRIRNGGVADASRLPRALCKPCAPPHQCSRW